MRPPVIIIGGNENGLSIARSLGPSGTRVYALGGSDWLGRSRYIEPIDCDQPECNAREQLDVWLNWLLGPAAARFQGCVLIPCSDVAVEMIARNRPRLRSRYLLDESADEITLMLLDKVHTYRIAQRIGVEAPRIWELSDLQSLQSVLPEVRYPCAIKPRNSVDFWRRLRTKLMVANDESELLSHYARVAEFGFDALLTEVIPGADHQYFSYWSYVDSDGELHFHFTKRKYRQDPIHHGTGTFHASVVDHDTRELGERFVRGSGVRGIAVVEFKRDARDGRLKLMECNVRFTQSNEILVRSGIDLPKLVYGRITGTSWPTNLHFREGVRLWFPDRDIRALLQYRRAGELSLREWACTLLGRTYVSMVSLRDPGPVFEIVSKRIVLRVRRMMRS